MLFRKVLKSFTKEELPLYYSLQTSPSFLEMLVNLRAELVTANLTYEDLPESPKNAELSAILGRFEDELNLSYANFSEFQYFIQSINDGKFNQVLHKAVIIIDGYTRFTAEEESFISALHSRFRCHWDLCPLIRYKLTDFSLSVYTNALEMMRFRNKFIE